MPLHAMAQDALRGSDLYRVLPGQPALGSCISCHGDPVSNRNSVLRGAAGGALISKTITAVARMGYLRQYLSDPDLADISAYLATVVPAGPIESLPDIWPTADDFGSQLVGTQSSGRVLLIRNRLPRAEIAIAAVLTSDGASFPVQHDCPVALPPLGQCRITAWFKPQTEGPKSASFSVVESNGRVLRQGTLMGAGVASTPTNLAWVGAPPDVLDFGQVTVGQSADRDLELVNGAQVPVALTTLRITGPNAARFTLDASCAALGRLEAAEQCKVRVGFAPTAAGRAEGWIELVADAGNAPLVRIAAAGVALAASPASSVAPAAESSGGGALSLAWLALLGLAVVALGARSPR